jgi:hypothetical protein
MDDAVVFGTSRPWGGRRPRCAARASARAWCLTGRWGPRRVRVTECLAVLTAEELYTRVLRDGVRHVRHGHRGDARWTVGTSVLLIAFELRANAVWRFGRLFLHCPTCGRRVTRMYVVTSAAPAMCRLCWGLTYSSRQHRNYKEGGLFAFAGLTLRWFAASETLRERQCRAAAARERYAERRAIVTDLQPT